MLCRQFAGSGETNESVSNDDGDGNKNGKKAMGLDWHNNNFARRSRPPHEMSWQMKLINTVSV